ncbi:MAG: phosphoribosylformylglycinamidine synthase I [Henriciella sp.]|jgi:phosphoribosylformylglycinamidine synthase|uniref:phosphoribosylformylglycinamidine synthase subunit PurQ n=1 Tax=Henriciella sp. TaxID=1968823 RepID=UPI000C0D7C24|nr:phosphoribosylformylglycinamidine synthase subunit PurQ [Henriciella sp.]MAN74551.1 phosphoribosylformylglycinamidine synthase I [Henriciella sp.]MBF32663.1 phosphoribosylformylglycinamidine synthase I [Hyphomonadaceae bacterium]PHR72944.1 MAG: phosphoribosylformylglycinamidine synthase I [Henriciella sp.]|tara:strand:- start:15 stop:677 length:663 start_codon:yes stop_codon:yes gene_type:complete
MKSAVIVFPGSNCDRDAQTALTEVTGEAPAMVWHKDGELPDDVDLVVVPGGFSYGDYLRCGAMAANSPVIAGLRRHAERGGYVLGVCNGFQVLTETQLLPGALLRNAGLDFVCRPQPLRIETSNSAFTSAYGDRDEVTIPVAHHDGNYVADENTLDRLEGEGRVAFRYAGNPNGSARDIAGVLSENGRVLGLMPHPERAIGGHEGGSDGRGIFESLIAAI